MDSKKLKPCLRCGDPTTKSHCEKHLKEIRERKKERVLKRRAKGLCIQCGEKAVDNEVYCQKHKEIINRQKRANYKKTKNKVSYVKTTCDIPLDLKLALEEYAKLHEKTQSETIISALKEFLKFF